MRSVAHRFGGSHAQRDLIDLTLIEAARARRRRSCWPTRCSASAPSACTDSTHSTVPDEDDDHELEDHLRPPPLDAGGDSRRSALAVGRSFPCRLVRRSLRRGRDRLECLRAPGHHRRRRLQQPDGGVAQFGDAASGDARRGQRGSATLCELGHAGAKRCEARRRHGRGRGGGARHAACALPEAGGAAARAARGLAA